MHIPTTHNIANTGFRGMRMFVSRKKGRCNLTGNRPQSATFHICTVSPNITPHYLRPARIQINTVADPRNEDFQTESC